MIPKTHFRGESDQWTEARMWLRHPHSSTDYCIHFVNSLLWRRDVPSRSIRSLSIRRVKPNPDGWGRVWLTKIWTDAIQMTSSKHIFSPRFIPHKMFQNYILLHVLIKKMLFGEFFLSKSKSIPLFLLAFWSILAGWESYKGDSQATNRSAPEGVGVLVGRSSQGALPASYWLAGSHIWFPAARQHTFL